MKASVPSALKGRGERVDQCLAAPGLSSAPSDAMTFNDQKSSRYAFAHSRIRRAMSSGFYLEALTILESMITDRLLASLDHRLGVARVANRGLCNLIERHRNEMGLDTAASADGKQVADVFEALDTWRKERNDLIHGFGKCIPGSALENPSALIGRAEQAAEEGVVLFRMLDSWLRRQMPKPVA